MTNFTAAFPELSGLEGAFQEKFSRLHEIIASYPSAIAAFSGGVDSSLLAVVGARILGERFMAVTVRSEFNSAELAPTAETFAQDFGIRHVFMDMAMTEREEVVANTAERCYHCKLHMMTALWRMARELGFAVVIEGQNADDEQAYRPGRRAVTETGTRSPFAEANLNKAEIRGLSKLLGLPTWNAPSSPCLATRFPYGTRLEVGELRRVEAAEARVKDRGMADCRVRSIAGCAVIEVAEPDFSRLIEGAVTLNREIIELGFERCLLDLGAYRSGSFDKGLKNKG